jgi:hypothetical protein
MKNKENIKIEILFIVEGKGAEGLLIEKINLYAKQIGGVELNHKIVDIKTGGGFNKTIKDKIIKPNNNSLKCVIIDVDSKNDKSYYDLIDFIKTEEHNIMFLLSNRQIEYWFELCINKESTPTELKNKEYYDNIKNQLYKKIITEINSSNIKQIFNNACSIEKHRQGNNFDYDREKSYSTLYRLIDYLKKTGYNFNI